MIDSLQDGSWLAGWVSLFVVVVSSVAAFYETGQKRNLLLKDIEIYERWSGFGDRLQLCRLKLKIESELDALCRKRDLRRFAAFFVVMAFVFAIVAFLEWQSEGRTWLLWAFDAVLSVFMAIVVNKAGSAKVETMDAVAEAVEILADGQASREFLRDGFSERVDKMKSREAEQEKIIECLAGGRTDREILIREALDAKKSQVEWKCWDAGDGEQPGDNEVNEGVEQQSAD